MKKAQTRSFIVNIIFLFIMILFCLSQFSIHVFAQPATPHNVTLTVWNANGTDYPQGTTGENGVTFECWLKDASNGWAESEHHTQNDGNPGDFDYIVSGGTHDILIRLDKFTSFNWAVGDHIVIVITDVEDPFSGETSTFEGTINGSPEIESLGDITLPVQLSSFYAEVFENNVLIKWTTQSEVNHLGFNLYRSLHQEEGFQKINTNILPGIGNSTTSHHYTYQDHDVLSGNMYYYKLESIDRLGNKEYFGPISIEISLSAIPTHFELSQNYPNPFNQSTKINYQLDVETHIQIKIYNLNGQEIIKLVDGFKKAGRYRVVWEGRDNLGRNLPSGIYVYQVIAGEKTNVKKLILSR